MTLPDANFDSSTDNHDLDHLFHNNRQWAASMTERDPTFFAKLQAQQSPQILWIGCSDSRVPANELLGLFPGDVFVHRNIANVIVHSDLNCLSVLQFAVDVLADNWLRHVQDVHQKHERYLGEALAPALRHNRLCELNVMEQVVNLCQTTIVNDAWERGQALTIHSWVYGLGDGLLRDLGVTVNNADELTPLMARSLARYEDHPPQLS
jgi:carbonic anhydrase